MMHLQRLAGEFFSRLEKLDEMIAVAVAGCRHCDGPLQRGDYLRKPEAAFLRLCLSWGRPDERATL